MHYICSVSIAPLRKEPADRSEMVTQLLFGETVVLLQTDRQWAQVQCTHDGYIGWIDQKQLLPLPLHEYNLLMQELPMWVGAPVHRARLGSQPVYLVFGSRLPFYTVAPKLAEGYAYRYTGKVISPNAAQPAPAKTVLGYSRLFVNAPYLWGGRTVFGIDCSGFTQMVFRAGGYDLLRDANQQVLQGTPVENYADILPADLAFFGNTEGKIVHVGICLHRGGGAILHASGCVRTDFLTPQGIQHAQTGKMTHQLAAIRRFCG